MPQNCYIFNMKQCDFLRKKHPKFIYRNFAINRGGNSLKVRFNFHLEPDLDFHPEISILNIPEPRLGKIGGRALQNFAFHCGLSEMTSYWKTTCSPEIVIEAGYLNKEQIKWWRKLILNGMGQFFYENRIDWRNRNFLKIKAGQDLNCQRKHAVAGFSLQDRYLVPFAGGRDSIVTLENLKKRRKEIALFTVNPINKIQRAVKVSGIKKQIIVKRVIDKKLLELNKKGYLNGHK